MKNKKHYFYINFLMKFYLGNFYYYYKKKFL